MRIFDRFFQRITLKRCFTVINICVSEIIDIFGNTFAVHIFACINQHTLLIRQFNKYAVTLSDIKQIL